MPPKVTSVRALPEFRLLLGYDSGESRVFDVSPYLDRGFFTRLRDPQLFALARVEYGTVTWPGDLDIASETLDLRSTPEDAAA